MNQSQFEGIFAMVKQSGTVEAEEVCFGMEKEDPSVPDRPSGKNVSELSPLSCLDGDVDNCTTSSIASCSDSGICSTPHNEQEIEFEDIPLNTTGNNDAVDGGDFESSLSEKLAIQLATMDSTAKVDGKKQGKFR